MKTKNIIIFLSDIIFIIMKYFFNEFNIINYKSHNSIENILNIIIIND